MSNNLFAPFFSHNTNKLDYIKYNTIGDHKTQYFDYTASGLGFRPIENRVYNVLKTYANTHSKEASMANITHQHYNMAIESLKNSLELNDEFAIIPTGCGSTAAIKKFQELLGLYIPPATLQRLNMDIDTSKLPLVIVGPFEHHSNEVSYREAMCEVQRIKLNEDGLMDLIQLEEVLQKNQHREIIATFCVASNVTGIITCYKEISTLLRKYNATVCLDAAASSSYMNVDCNYFDAMFISPHKLLGGPGSCGVLVIKKSLVDTSLAPSFSGGGTVKYVSQSSQIYEEDISARETAGTPGILQLIRAALAYQLRNEIGFDFILKRKQALLTQLLEGLKTIPNIVIYGNKLAKNIGIVSFNIARQDPYEICELLSQKGMQTRAGCSCAGPYGHDLLGLKDQIDLKDRPGWVRVSIHYSQTKEEVQELIEAIRSSIK
ncbi:aminotransferase class V-fold PLP-dependent enzyme [Candidatus Marinarcus aquaticus]|uniref:Aminotransferase n=1 Tax=Candidatus Marinarcus aquaticus TaxID=2044504 RepID=A0A4Q0XR33_9BACT|nr:aminotransferase class V-fold PLP-dependent enzyme [Candidatus Marinarcus aquaticus]RXJ58162.1 aminotransferase [Candidatus Marinarcus aquaticus]